MGMASFFRREKKAESTRKSRSCPSARTTPSSSAGSGRKKKKGSPPPPGEISHCFDPGAKPRQILRREELAFRLGDVERPDPERPPLLQLEQRLVDGEVGIIAVVHDVLHGIAELREEKHLAHNPRPPADGPRVFREDHRIVRSGELGAEIPDFVEVPQALHQGGLARGGDRVAAPPLPPAGT